LSKPFSHALLFAANLQHIFNSRFKASQQSEFELDLAHSARDFSRIKISGAPVSYCGYHLVCLFNYRQNA